MNQYLIICILLINLLFSVDVFARGGGHSRSNHSSSSSHSKTYCSSCARDKSGKIKRNSNEREKFLKSQGLTHTPKGYQVDHTVPLAKGGKDKTSNMQLIPKNSAKEKNELK